MFFSPRGGIVSLTITLITFGTMSWLILTGRVILVTPIPAALADWISNSVITLLFSVIIIVGFQHLDAEFLVAQKKREEAARELENQNMHLEDRVAERTLQFKTVNEVGRAASSVLDPDELIDQVANLITDQFKYYYTALFLVDPTRRWAELKSATGEAGRVLKESKHRLEVGGKSMVGTAISTRSPRVALNVGVERTRFEIHYSPIRVRKLPCLCWLETACWARSMYSPLERAHLDRRKSKLCKAWQIRFPLPLTTRTFSNKFNKTWMKYGPSKGNIHCNPGNKWKHRRASL